MSTTLTHPAASRAQVQAALALLYTAVILTVLEFWFMPTRIEAALRGLPPEYEPAPSLRAGTQWAGATFIAFLVIPGAIVLLFHRERLSSIGYRARAFLRHIWVYLGLFAVMAPAIWLASQRQDFLAVYPFVGEAKESMDRFLRWEGAYVAQFIALESFFRGYLLFTLEKAIGKMAIFVMVVPYCMIHYHKPAPEAFGAIIAGVVLGYLALRYRSWYGGALLHGLVALSMDSLSAYRSGLWD